MKKTLTVNLGGTVYHIDEDAYRLLDNYLLNLTHFFRKQEGADEIVDDIEMRISELFTEKLAGLKQVITLTDVEEVIARMGKPEDFDDSDAAEAGAANSGADSASASSGADAATDAASASSGENTFSGENTSSDDNCSGDAPSNDASSDENASSQQDGVQRRLYRDPDNRLMGGVAAGLAAYFGWDVTLMRVLMIVLCFVPYCPMILCYLLGWLIIPEAHTAAEKLSMRGEAVTLENIGRTVTDGFEKVTDGMNDCVNSAKSRTFMQKLGDGIVTVAAILFKVFLIALIILCCPLLFFFALALVGMFLLAILMIVTGGAVFYEFLPDLSMGAFSHLSPLMTLASFVAGMLSIGIPLAALVHVVLRRLFQWAPMGNVAKWFMLILWVASVVMLIFALTAIQWPVYGNYQMMAF